MRFHIGFIMVKTLIISRMVRVITALGILTTSCRQPSDTLFHLLPVRQSGITFSNLIPEDEYFNIISYEYIYNGGGVGIGDFNNDGLQDIFFSGNLVKNKLYLNLGGLKFRDVSGESGIEAEGIWCTGATVVDINSDGWQDIYVCTDKLGGQKGYHNILFINQGPDRSGIPVFKDRSEEYGINYAGSSMSSAFFDADNDGDLDLYILTSSLGVRSPNKFWKKQNNGHSDQNDRFYRNNGDGTFTDETIKAGIVCEGYGLGISIRDFNLDGWKDIYVTNDYVPNDVLYINNRDGTFTNRIRNYLRHQSHSSMGHDVADINNDGWPDIISLDMLPEYNQRQKRMLFEAAYSKYILNERFGYEYQYLRNMLQLNNGTDRYGNHNFSEIGLYAGIFATDWTWAPLLADLDNDGCRDLYISNGYPRDITDLDYNLIRSKEGIYSRSRMDLLNTIPVAKIANYGYKNNGDLTFKKVTKEWGFDHPSFSNGAAYADLDNDGDLEIITNNINDRAFVFENTAESRRELSSHFLRIRLSGPDKNRNGLGTFVMLRYGNGKILYQEYSPYHGYMSSMDPVMHFGLGSSAVIDSLIVTWPDGRSQMLTGIPADTTITLEYGHAGDQRPFLIKMFYRPPRTVLREVSTDTQLKFLHKDRDYIDFNIQKLIPHKFSQYGPALAVADIDNDGWFDLFIGGSSFYCGTFFKQQNGKFHASSFEPDRNNKKEDLGVLFFDADGDGDQDLYIASGGYEGKLSAESYTDRLYLNDGRGNFSREANALPGYLMSSSCVKAADFDRDGDLDLFIGGLIVPEEYPKPAGSVILRNDSEGSVKFTNVTKNICPALTHIGLVKDALWSDFNNDGLPDLILAGEWMPVTFLKNTGSSFKDITRNAGVTQRTGWWNSLAAGDFDNDGDTDYLAGNLGLNTIYKGNEHEPVVAWSADFDNNGTYDVVLGCYLPDSLGGKKLFPVHSLDDLIRQMNFMKDRVPTYARYAHTSFKKLFTKEEAQRAMKLQANWFYSSYIENLGQDTFSITPLPTRVQFAPVFGMIVKDIDRDGNLDALLVGNDYGNDVFWGRYDAFNGLWLKGDGHNHFSPVNYPLSGFFVPGDAKALVTLPVPGNRDLILASQNMDSLRVFSLRNNRAKIKLKDDDACCVIKFKNGTKRREEFYYGHTFLSQSARVLYIPENAEKITVFSFTGEKRNIPVNR